VTHAHHEAHVRRSIEDVLDFLADGSNDPVERARELLETAGQTVWA
jgi:hypothetical protein